MVLSQVMHSIDQRKRRQSHYTILINIRVSTRHIKYIQATIGYQVITLGLFIAIAGHDDLTKC